MGATGNYQPNDEFIAAIRGLRLLMKFLGIWQQPNSPGWYNLVWYVQSAGIMFFISPPIAGLIVNRHDASKTIDNLGILTPTTITGLHWISFALNRKPIGELLEFMERDWINLKNDTPLCRSVPDCKRIMTKYFRYANIFFYTFVSMMACGVTTYVHDSLVSLRLDTNGTDFERIDLFPTPYSWYPLDYTRGYTYEILFAGQVITSIIISLARASMDNFFVTVTLNLCAQFEILRSFIESITYDSSQPECCTEKVRLMIRRHQELLRAAERLQKSCSFIIAGQYAAVTMTICFLGYALIAEMEKTDASIAVVLKTGSFCGAFLQLMFSYCLVGDKLTNQSIAIVGAIYNSGWYSCPRSICLSFMIVIVRAHRPVEISGANLILMSLDSFTNLIRASVSYLSVLRAMGVSDG